MDLTRFEKITDYHWRLRIEQAEKRWPHFYGDETLLSAMEDKVGEQIANVSRLPGLVNAAMVMPDGHWGYGFPIGGVAAFDAQEGGVICAGGVGFDISCGIRCLRSEFLWEEIASYQMELAGALYNAIPAGVGVPGSLKLSVDKLEVLLQEGALWAVKNGYGTKEDLEFVEEGGQMKGADPRFVSELAKTRQKNEMGTLGSGNHYLEVQVVETIYDLKTAQAFGLFTGQVLISIHCGSRGLGHQIGTDYLISLLQEAKSFGLNLPDRELACAPLLSQEGQAYLGAMRSGINCALANRQILTHLTREIFQKILPKAVLTTFYDVSHNTCKEETHWVGNQKKQLYVHRKGATRAFGPGHPDLPASYREVGQPVIIGGSMGTASYVLAGNDTTVNQAFASASHGAGRAMSRRQSAKMWRGKDLIESLSNKGIIIRSHTLRGVAEEAPLAYKAVEKVACATEEAGLARRVALLRPKICIKG